MINGALCNLYGELQRDGGGGLEHVEALLRLRGVAPEAVHVAIERKRIFRRGESWRAMLEIQRAGQMPSGEIAARLLVESPDKCPRRAGWSVYVTRGKSRATGLAAPEGRQWGLV